MPSDSGSISRAPFAKRGGAEGGGDLGQAGGDRPHAHDQHQHQRGGPGPGQRDDPGGQVGQGEQEVPGDRPGLGGAERAGGLQSGGDERLAGEQDDQRQHRDRGRELLVAG